jgi:D-alanyl-lipoteichoic acid acyltransferase DltB (MBOAT superfamily)
MLLTTGSYFVFLVAIFFLYWPVARSRSLALAVILFANYFFYAKWDLAYLFLVPAASTTDFLIGLGIQASSRQWLRRLLVALSLLVNIGILASLRYTHWSLPLALSFYVFQSLTYTLDVYRRDAKATTSLLAHLASVSFFPTTLAGPITRVAQLLPQLDRPVKVLAAAEGGRALFLIGMGLVKKLLVADYLADNLVNRVFDFPSLYTGAEVLIGVWGYALQLYYDFSGYTDIAIGSALLLGIKLPANFNRPYSAESVPDFWRRWHITLSNWLRDYLYFSLPGLRSKWKVFTYANLIITMAIGGLWHGASRNFVIWGLLHGCALALTRWWQNVRGNPKPSTALSARVVRTFCTVQFVCFAWIFFRAEDLNSALAILGRIGSLTFSLANISAPLALVLAIAALGHYTPKNWYESFAGLYSRSPFWVQAAAMLALVIGIQYVTTTGAAPFIYTRF